VVTASTARWFLGVADGRAAVKLLCLPHAGGCASSYRAWLRDVGPDIDLLPVQLPGRETRADEPLATDMAALVAELSSVVRAQGFPSVALFGHSMGAVIATLLCRSLERAGGGIAALLVSGHPGPDAPLVDASGLDDQQLDRALSAHGPLFEERLSDPELRRLFLPVIRADARLSATVPLGGEPVDAPITVLAGSEDAWLASGDLGSWRRLTRGRCQMHRLPGDHFYLTRRGPEVAAIVRAALGFGESRP
jgi:surfactin synthase thioesterase subunit